ncbi:hypothetical protein ACHAXT_009518 [Thalassiosira profunda]
MAPPPGQQRQQQGRRRNRKPFPRNQQQPPKQPPQQQPQKQQSAWSHVVQNGGRGTQPTAAGGQGVNEGHNGDARSQKEQQSQIETQPNPEGVQQSTVDNGTHHTAAEQPQLPEQPAPIPPQQYHGQMNAMSPSHSTSPPIPEHHPMMEMEQPNPMQPQQNQGQMNAPPPPPPEPLDGIHENGYYGHANHPLMAVSPMHHHPQQYQSPPPPMQHLVHEPMTPPIYFPGPPTPASSREWDQSNGYYHQQQHPAHPWPQHQYNLPPQHYNPQYHHPPLPPLDTTKYEYEWDPQNLQLFLAQRAHMLEALFGDGGASNGKASEGGSSPATDFGRSKSDSVAAGRPIDGHQYARAASVGALGETPPPSLPRLGGNSPAKRRSSRRDSDQSDSEEASTFYPRTTVQARLEPLLPFPRGQCAIALWYLLMDTPLPLARCPPKESRNDVGKWTKTKALHPRPPNPNETVCLLPRDWMKDWIHAERCAIMTSYAEAFFVEGGMAPEESEQSSPQQQQNPQPRIKRTFTLCFEALKALAALSVLADQYEIHTDTEFEWKLWLDALEGGWNEWREKSQEMTGEPLPPYPHLCFPAWRLPGPADSRVLLGADHPLMMHDNVRLVLRGLAHGPAGNGEVDEDALNNLVDDLRIGSEGNGSSNEDLGIPVCPVPSQFYDQVRGTKGVYCANGDLSFGDENGGDLPSSLLFHDQWEGDLSSQYPPIRPVEFRRRVVSVPLAVGDGEQIANGSPHTTKKASYAAIMRDATKSQKKTDPKEDTLASDKAGLTVEVFPVEIRYVVAVDGGYGVTSPGEGTDNSSLPKPPRHGVALASRRSPVRDVLHDLQRAAAPDGDTACTRIWMRSRCMEATNAGDGYELVDLDSLSRMPTAKEVNMSPQRASRKSSKSKEDEEPSLTVEQWLGLEELSVRSNASGPVALDLLVEVRSSPTSSWSRESLELENRLQVGDFVDAQDGAHKWYEAIVREVTPATVKVHYFGWASKWDADLPRRKGTDSKLSPPMPLWTKSVRWRELIKAGDDVEVRESTSMVERPKWHRAHVLAVGNEGDDPRELQDSAELEKLEVDGLGRKVPLVLLKRKRQILVEVPQEIHNCPSAPLTPPRKGAQPVANPPFRRWINLFGEEVCKVNTHKTAKRRDNSTGATLNYTMESQRQPVEVMKPFNNIHGSGFVRESLRGIPPAAGTVGLHNLGNSCYMNSILQCVNHIQPITQYFRKGEYQKEINKRNPLGSGGKVATAYANFLNEIYSGEYSIVAPRTLKMTVSLFAPQFNNNYQHDSQEFCQYLFDGLHEDLNRVKEKPYVERMEALGMEDATAAMESWQQHLLRHDSIFVDRTQGLHKSHVSCTTCGKQSVKFDVYSSISLPLVPPKERTSIPLEDCLDQFELGEQLDERNAWYCSGCKKHVCALKRITLWNTPDILVLHLKRFTFEKCPIVDGKIIRRKIEDTVDFPIDRLDLSKYVAGPQDPDAPPVYKLFGVSEHTGTTANSGHYTATVRNSEDGNWYRYNDSHVGTTSGDAAVTGGAYLLFYERAKGSLRWAGMEKQMANQGIATDADGFQQVKGKKKKKP